MSYQHSSILIEHVRNRRCQLAALNFSLRIHIFLNIFSIWYSTIRWLRSVIWNWPRSFFFYCTLYSSFLHISFTERGETPHSKAFSLHVFILISSCYSQYYQFLYANYTPTKRKSSNLFDILRLIIAFTWYFAFCVFRHFYFDFFSTQTYFYLIWHILCDR